MKTDKKLRSINTHFWVDSYVVELDPSEKLLFLYLLTNPWTNLIGVYEIPIRQISFDTGFDKEMVLKMINRFSKDDKVYYFQNYVILANFLKNQNFNANMQKGADARIDELPKEIKQFIALKNIKGFERIRKDSKGFKTVRKEEREVEEEVEGEERNDFKQLNYKFDLTAHKNPDEYSDQEKRKLANLIFEELKNSNQWHDDVCRTANINKTEAWHQISSFVDEIVSKEDYFKPIREIKRHCVSWIKKHQPVINGR